MRLKALTLAVCSIALLSISMTSLSQEGSREELRPMVSPYAEVLQRIYTTDVKITYHRPAVKERVVWGELVPFDSEKPWRAGANNSTTFSINKDVKIEGKPLPAGNYTLFVAVEDGEWTFIINKMESGWGSMQYNEKKDALRVAAKPKAAPHKERLVYGFEELEEKSAVMYLHWEKMKGSIQIEVE